MLSVVVACCSRDQDQALSLLNWIGELGMNYTKLFIFCSKECRTSELIEAGKKGFAEVNYLRDVEEVNSNWFEIGHHNKSAAGPNSLFRQIAWHFYLTEKTPFLFLEPDAIPCHVNWLRDISDEYDLCIKYGKHFLGYEVTRNTHPGDVGHHMSGVAVYPFDVPQKAHTAIHSGDTAFDIEGASRIIPQMMPSKTIFHRYRPPSFESQEDFDQRVPRNLAVYHANKDGTLIPFLRKRLGITSDPEEARKVLSDFIRSEPPGQIPANPSISGSAPFIPTHPVVDIFIKTREHDYPWLKWCLTSIDKYTSGFRDTVVRYDTGDVCMAWPNRTHDSIVFNQIPIDKREPGYLWQQVCKLHADQHTDADFILFQDSDTIFTRPVTPSDFIKDGKAVWLYTPLDQARPDQHHWIGVMEKFLGKKPEHEWMRAHPFCVPRWAFEELRVFCKYRHGKTIEDYIMGEADPSNGLALRFSEWNCLGFFLWEYHRDKIHWVLDSKADPACCMQGFTHGGEERKQQDLAKFREILEPVTSVPREVVNVVEGEPRQRDVPIHATHSLTESSAIEFLASQVRDNPHKARIIRQLKAAWRGKGVKNEKKSSMTVGTRLTCGDVVMDRSTGKFINNGLLLCIHSYPGANETMARHWPNFLNAGATRIAGIGTTDGKCTWPDGLDAVVDIGENAYMKFKGKDDHLCRRLLDTVKWCLTQPEDRFAIVEYDTLILKPFPQFSGVHAHLTGGRVNGSKTKQFHHNPWAWGREHGPQLIAALEAALPHSREYPNNSPDLFFGLACEMANIKVTCPWKMFTRNSLDSKGDLELAVEAALDGAHVIHGVKTAEEYFAITNTLKEKHLPMSNVA